MTRPNRRIRARAAVRARGCLFIGTGFVQSWNTALTIFNMGLVSAIMALGVNMQWGYAGLFNVGVMGFVALGGLAAVLVSMPPVDEAWAAGGVRVSSASCSGPRPSSARSSSGRACRPGRLRTLAMITILIGGFFVFRAVFDAGVSAVEAVDPASTGYLGGLGLPVILAWPVGGLLAAGAAWIIGKTALGLRSDYLAIATLGIAEIIIAILKNEDWLARGVKNVTGIPARSPTRSTCSNPKASSDLADRIGADPVTFSSITVKLSYGALFIVVLIALIWLSEKALNSPWGRMMRAIRDNETAAEAMGKDVKARHLQVFVLGSAVCGLAGAMMTTLDSQLVPGHLPAAALHLPHLGHGDRRRVGQQLGRGAGRVPDLVALDHGRAAGPRPHADHHLGDGRGLVAARSPHRFGGLHAALHHGADPASGAALQPARPDPGTLTGAGFRGASSPLQTVASGGDISNQRKGGAWVCLSPASQVSCRG
jgi:branched-chain amino acid transport system permease protein